jgi:hypothetical protein
MRRRLTIFSVLGGLSLFTGLCWAMTVVVAAADGWQEFARSRWPRASAVIEQCGVDLRYFDGPNSDDPTWWLECKIRFRVGARDVETTIHSGHQSRPARGYPEPMIHWVDAHPPGGAIVVRYDPADLRAEPVRNYLPNGEPRTPTDLRWLLGFSIAFPVCLAMTRISRRLRSAPAKRV